MKYFLTLILAALSVAGISQNTEDRIVALERRVDSLEKTRVTYDSLLRFNRKLAGQASIIGNMIKEGDANNLKITKAVETLVNTSFTTRALLKATVDTIKSIIPKDTLYEFNGHIHTPLSTENRLAYEGWFLYVYDITEQKYYMYINNKYREEVPFKK